MNVTYRKGGCDDGVVGCTVCRSYRTLSVPSSRRITFLSGCLVSYFQVVSLALSGGERRTGPDAAPPDVIPLPSLLTAYRDHAKQITRKR